MHESDSFISEVSEEVRRDRLFATLRRYRWLIGGAVLLIVGGAAANEWWKAHSGARAEAAGDALQAAYAEADPATRAGMLGDLAAADPRAAALVRLAEAGSLADAGETDKAAALLAEVAGDGAVGQLYRSLASLERVMLLGAAMEPSERQATLELLTAPGAPFRPLALEQRALMHLDAGDGAAAIADLQAILAEPGATEALRARAQQLLVAAGGPLAAASADG